MNANTNTEYQIKGGCVVAIKTTESGKTYTTQVANAPIRCLARLKDVDGHGYGLRFGWTDEDGEEQDYSCWLNEAWSPKSDVSDFLVKEAGGGFFKPSDFRAFVHNASSAARAGEIPTLPSTSRAGWGAGYRYYTANGYQCGGDGSPVYMSRRGAKWSQAGDRDLYLDRMRELLADNPVVAFICGFFAAGALVKSCGAENFMLSLVGRTSTGKTLAVKTALSMRGNPSDYATFDSTAGALKALLRQSGDSCLAIDEIGQSGMTAEQKQKLLYDISQGKERGRLRKNGEDFAARESEKIHYTTIFTGEESITSTSHAGGAQVRVTEFVFDGQKSKLWDSITSAADAEELEQFLTDNHGWLLPLVIERIHSDPAAARVPYNQILSKFRTVAEADGLDSATARKIKTFALALTGATILGEILDAELGFDTPVSDFAMAQLLNGAIHAGNSDEEKFMDFISGLPVRYAERLFGSGFGSGGATPVRATIGEITGVAGAMEIRLIASELEKLCARDGLDAKRFIDWAAQAGVLRCISNGTGKRLFKRKIKIAGSIVSGYEFRVDVEEDDMYTKQPA